MTSHGDAVSCGYTNQSYAHYTNSHYPVQHHFPINNKTSNMSVKIQKKEKQKTKQNLTTKSLKHIMLAAGH